VVISMGSTQIKKSKQWMTRMSELKMQRADGTRYTPAMFSHIYRLSSIAQSNAIGSWMGWQVDLVTVVPDARMYEAGRAFRDAVVSGEAKAQPPAAADDELTF